MILAIVPTYYKIYIILIWYRTKLSNRRRNSWKIVSNILKCMLYAHILLCYMQRAWGIVYYHQTFQFLHAIVNILTDGRSLGRCQEQPIHKTVIVMYIIHLTLTRIRSKIKHIKSELIFFYTYTVSTVKLMFCHSKYRDLIVQFLNNVSLKRITIITLYLYFHWMYIYNMYKQDHTI